MLGELGQLAFCFALALSLVMAISGLLGAGADQPNTLIARRVASATTLGMMVFVVLAFGTLVTAFVTSDFSVADVANNSHTLKPLIYKSPACGAITKAPCCFGCWCCRFMPARWRAWDGAASV